MEIKCGGVDFCFLWESLQRGIITGTGILSLLKERRSRICVHIYHLENI